MPDTPLTFVHSNRVERLADALAVALRNMPEAAPLASPHIVVPHGGLGRWLERALAERMGIAFGLRFVLPGQFLWELDRRLFGTEREDDAYGVGPLALRILGELARDAGAPEWGKFNFILHAPKKRENSTLTLILFEISAKDGSRQHELPIALK